MSRGISAARQSSQPLARSTSTSVMVWDDAESRRLFKRLAGRLPGCSPEPLRIAMLGVPLLAILTCTASATIGEPADSIVAFAQEHLGSQVGSGACTDLARAALTAAGAHRVPGESPDAPFSWGSRVDKRADIQPGDILQFEQAVFRGRRLSTRNGQPVVESYRTTFPNHTAIVESTRDNGRILVILHQNAGPFDLNDPERKKVRRDTLRFADLRPGGSVTCYRPQLRAATQKSESEQHESAATPAP